MPEPVTTAAAITAGASIIRDMLFGGDDGRGAAKESARAAEREGRSTRQLTRDELLLELIAKAIEVDHQNRIAQRNAELSAPNLSRIEEKLFNPPSQTVARNAAFGRAAPEGEEGDAARSLTAANFEQFQAMRGNARNQAARITPESLFVGQENPLDRVDPELFVEGSFRDPGRPTFTPGEAKRVEDRTRRAFETGRRGPGR